jgi:hypothetical protein
MNHHHSQTESSKKEYFKLALVFVLIAVAATVMSTTVEFHWTAWMRWFMGGFFLIFGSFKLIGYEHFVQMFPRYDIIARRYKLYAYFYPFIELALAFAYILDLAPLLRDSFTLAFVLVGAYGVAQGLAKAGTTIHCACLGGIIKLPLSTVTLLEDLLMAVMAAFMLLAMFTGQQISP